jgi:hypothetical protein
LYGFRFSLTGGALEQIGSPTKLDARP